MTIRKSQTRITATTSSLRFNFDLNSGGWRLSARNRRKIFESAPDQTGRLGRSSQLGIRLDDGERIFGLGESTGTFDKRGLIREFWNVDLLGHAAHMHAQQRNLYVSIPFALSWKEGRIAGLFWDNPSHQIWDLGQTKQKLWKMTAASGGIDLYLFAGPDPQSVLSRYTELTGRIPMPPRWALGFHQCRYSYETRRRVEGIASEFRKRRIPCDAIYLDIHHMHGYRVFSFAKAFRRPADLIRKLTRKGFKVVAIVDPGVKNDPKFKVLQRGKQIEAFVKRPDGKRDYIGEVWPGKARFPDFFQKHVREWWGKEQSKLLRIGIAGIWNDMNEPADFVGPGRTLPLSCRHLTERGPIKHADVHNVYGLQMARASRDGALKVAPNQRPFTITRAGYAGLQRHAMLWTGDNSSTWGNLADSIQMCLNLGLSGVAFCGADVGGFVGNTTPELLARWTQLAAFTPFFRNHSMYGTIDQEPWAFGSEVESICRHYIRLRYQLLPYMYRLFREAHLSGAPIMRPLFWHYLRDPIATAVADQFLLGPDLMVAPVLQQGVVARAVYLPGGAWFDLYTGQRCDGGQHILSVAPLERIPLFARAGAIIPMRSVQQHTGESPASTVHLHLWPEAPGRFEWYEDDGMSCDHERGVVYQRHIAANLDDHAAGWLHFGEANGSFQSEVRHWRVTIHNAQRRLKLRTDASLRQSSYDLTSRTCAFELRNSPELMKIKLG